MENTKIGLFGAAGAIGASIAAALRDENRSYRVVGRDHARLKEFYGTDPLAEIVTWDPGDPASVRVACRGVDTLVYLVGVPYDHFELHPVLMRKTLDGAIAESVSNVVLIGTVYPYGKPRSSPVKESHPRDPHTFKGRMRKEQEDALLQAHAEGRIRSTILRLPDFYGPHVANSFLHSLFQAAAGGGTATMVGPLDVPHEFVYVPDVGPVVLALAGKPQAYGLWWNLAGAGAISQREIVRMVFSEAGRQPKLRVAGKTMLRLIGLFNPVIREVVEMHYLFTNPLLLDDSALSQLLGGFAKTSYRVGLKLTLEAYRHG
jgi:nucleoside-diphosphate-sugar epimerase